MNYLILVAYDGTNYHGWQHQPHNTTIADTLIRTFKAVFHTQASLYGASRTDAGVHALGQVALVRTPLSLDPATIQRAWNARLPVDIGIRKVIECTSYFNPRANVEQKTYYYHFFLARGLPFVARYGAAYKRHLDLDKLALCLSLFTGTHNFRSFCTGNEQENTIRTINTIKLVYLKKFKTYRIIVQGPGFLRYMIRRIVGACLECATRKDMNPEDLLITLAACNPEHSLPTAPACGLLLRRIEYKSTPWLRSDV